ADQPAGEIGQRRSELEAELAKDKPAQAMLGVEPSQKELPAQESPRLEAHELQAAQAEVMQRVKRLTETLAEETKRREGAERQAGEIGQYRSKLEAELAENKQAQARLQQELEASQKQLRAQRDSSGTEQIKLEVRTQELQATHAEVEQKV